MGDWELSLVTEWSWVTSNTEWNALPILFPLINDRKQRRAISIFIGTRKNGYIPVSFQNTFSVADRL